MAMKNYRVLVAILVLLVSAIAIIYYLAKSNFLFYATGVFWHGAITGFAGCLFLLSLILIISLITAKSMLTKKRGLVFSMFISSGSVTATLFFSSTETLMFGGMVQLRASLVACFWHFWF